MMHIFLSRAHQVVKQMLPYMNRLLNARQLFVKYARIQIKNKRFYDSNCRQANQSNIIPIANILSVRSINISGIEY